MPPEILNALLDSLVEPVLFVDNQHVVRYLNRAAASHYRGGYDLLGSSIFDCHNATSNEVIRQIHGEMQAGAIEERKIIDNAKHVVFMRAVRDPQGQLLGYYERYERPGSENPST